MRDTEWKNQLHFKQSSTGTGLSEQLQGKEKRSSIMSAR